MLSYVVLLVSSGIVALSGLGLVGYAADGYYRTGKRELLYLTLGFVLIVAAAVATALSASLVGLAYSHSMVVVRSVMSAGGFSLVLLSLVRYE